jgi:hypothetical protein
MKVGIHFIPFPATSFDGAKVVQIKIRSRLNSSACIYSRKREGGVVVDSITEVGSKWKGRETNTRNLFISFFFGRLEHAWEV